MESWQKVPDGCSKHPECDTCPFEDCEAHMEDLNKAKMTKILHAKVLHMAWNKLSTDIISRRTGYSVRSVEEIINGAGV